MSLLQPDVAEQPVKRKRGRPAKQNKDEDIYPSFTMQFRAFPESFSPSAEVNSNMMMQMGEPDAFTPLMKVSPTPSRKKSRKNSSTPSTTCDSPSWELLTPMTNTHKPKPLLGLTPSTATKLSLITSEEYTPAYLNSPPDSALKPSLRMSPELPLRQPHKTEHKDTSRVLKSSPLQNKAPESPPPKEKRNLNHNISFIEDNLFSFELTVDDGGRANLAAKNDDKEQVSVALSEPAVADQARERSSIVSSADSCISMGTASLLGSLVSSVPGANFEHAVNDKFIVPQTPNQKDCATPRCDGMMDNYNMAFNLTPQFNSMMYSMMNINSPQIKYPHSPLRFLGAHEEQHYRKLDAIDTSINTAELMEGSGSSGPSSGPDFSADESDARAALKRAFKNF